MPANPILTVDATVIDGRASIWFRHPERREDWDAVREAMVLIRDEIDRIIQGERACPFRPKDRP